MALHLLPERHPQRVPLHIKPGADELLLTEGDLRPETQHEVAGNCFAPIPGLKLVKSGKTDFFHHGLYVVDEPCAGMAPRPHHDGHPQPVVERQGARIPDELVPGEKPPDIASMSLVPPTPDGLGLRSSVDACYSDLRHLARGGPQAASR